MRVFLPATLLLILSAVFGYFCFGPKNITPIVPAQLYIDQSKLIFDATTPIQREIEIRNNSAHAVTLTDISTSCPCLDATFQAEGIPAFGSVSIKLEIDSSKIRVKKNRETRVAFIVSYLTDATRVASTSKWHISFDRKRLLTASPTEIALRDPIPNSGSFHVSIRADACVDEINVETDESTVTPRWVRSGSESFLVTFDVSNSAQVGPFQFDAAVSATASDGRVIERIGIPVVGCIEKSVRIAPSTVVINKTNGQKHQELITAFKTTDIDPIEFSGISSPDLNITNIIVLDVKNTKSKIKVELEFSEFQTSSQAQKFFLHFIHARTGEKMQVPVNVVVHGAS